MAVALLKIPGPPVFDEETTARLKTEQPYGTDMAVRDPTADEIRVARR